MCHLRILFLPKRVWLLAFLFPLFLSVCSGRRDPTHEELLRDLPPELVQHLISSDDSTFTQYGREIGFFILKHASLILNNRMRDMYAKGYRDEVSPLIAYNKRIALVLASEYNYDLYIDRINYIENLPPESRPALMKEELDFYSYRDDSTIPSAQKLDRFLRFLESFVKNKNALFKAACEYELSYTYGELGKKHEQQKYLRAAYSDFADIGLHEMTVPILGELGQYYAEIGRRDSMIVCFEEAKRIAHRSRLPLETAEITSRYAWYYARLGRLSLAHDLLTQAMEICRKYKGEYSELRYITETMTFQADLSCWEIVNRLLERARVLQNKYKDQKERHFRLYSLQIDRTEGRMRMAQGEVDEAGAIFKKTWQATENLPMPYILPSEIATLFLYWSQGLLENGHLDEARDITRDGFRRSRQADLPKLAAQFVLLLAKTALQLDDLQTSRSALQQFDSLAGTQEEALQREWIEREILLGKLELRSGHQQAAFQALERGLARLRQSVSNRDASVQSYLWIGENEDLRQFLHDLISSDPVLGYGAELLWRDLYRLLGSRIHGERRSDSDHTYRTNGGALHPPHEEGAVAEKATIETLRKRAESARMRIAEIGAVHSIYMIRDGEIWRWTASSAGIRRDVLEGTVDDTRTLVNDTWKMMSPRETGPANAPPLLLIENLRALAHRLLPPEVLQGTEAGAEVPFLVTADGFLARIPFETFNVGNEDVYTPLLSQRDVAYLRYADRFAGASSSDPGVIVINARPSKELLKRYPFYQVLREVLPEGQAVAALNPNARFLAGEAATKTNLRSVWEDASFVYLAAHMLRDPQVPYLMLIPLATTGDSPAPDAAYLDITDIREADLSRCSLVVLSGCSSGEPYVARHNAGPSLGDAFLDAGAGAVVQTFWDVKDEEARQLMTSYVQSWESLGAGKIRALCETRRRAIPSPAAGGRSFAWASYAIKIGGL